MSDVLPPQFQRVVSGIDVTAALIQLDGQPELWRQHNQRLVSAGPHRETDDIWLRYRTAEELHGPEDFLGPHVSVWYPAWYALPALEPIVAKIMSLYEPCELGGMMLTRVPAGATVYPHHDRGTWHSEHYNQKVWFPLRANEKCFNYCEDDIAVMAPGEGWTFSNLKTHSVQNLGATERIVLIICMRAIP